MQNLKSIAQGSFLLGLVMMASACVIAPREGYYDRDHHRYYTHNTWHECGDRDDHCR